MSNLPIIRACLSEGSDEDLRKRMLKAAHRFYKDNQGADTAVLFSAIGTVTVDMLLSTMRVTFPDLKPGQFQQFMTQAAGMVERGEHLAQEGRHGRA